MRLNDCTVNCLVSQHGVLLPMHDSTVKAIKAPLHSFVICSGATASRFTELYCVTSRIVLASMHGFTLNCIGTTAW